jgi:uncharacterized protein YceH (UPF0502 family)
VIQLNPIESRVLGVLIEKAMTTPEQYPLSLNAATNGANQKNNRDPVLSLNEDEIFDALEGLREKGLAVRVDTPGSRVHKYRHRANEFLHIRPTELAILAELLLRGPQTLGEIRGRASRMAELDSLETTRGLLTAMMTCQEPLVKELPPAPGSRAERYMQLLCPELHPISVAAEIPASTAGPTLSDRVTTLENKVQTLTDSLNRLLEKLGETGA